MNILQLIKNIPDIIFAYVVCKKKGLKLKLTIGRDNCSLWWRNKTIFMDIDYPRFKAVFLHEYGHWVDNNITDNMFFSVYHRRQRQIMSVMGENYDVKFGPNSLHETLRCEVAASKYALRYMNMNKCLKKEDVNFLVKCYMTYQGEMRNLSCAPTLGTLIPYFDVKANALRKYLKHAK